MSTHISTLKLHQLRYGELEGREKGLLRQHLDDCAHCRQRLQAMQADRAEFELRPMPAAIRDLDRPPRSLLSRLRVRWVGLGLALATAAALLMVFQPSTTVPGADPRAMPGVRAKGETQPLEVWVEQDDSVVALGEGDSLWAGARIQLRFDPGDARWITLAGRDGSGALEIYGNLEATGADGLQSAPFSLVLDDTPGAQRFYAVMADRPIFDADVEAALGGREIEGVEVHELTFPKR